MKSTELLEADVVDLKKYKKERDAEELKQKLIRLASVDAPSAFQKQDDIEKLVKDTIEQIKKRSKTEKLDISSPTLMTNFQKGLPRIDYLVYNLPMKYEVEDTYKTKELRGLNVIQSREAASLAIRLSLKYADKIIAFLKEDLEKSKELLKLAKQAPAYQYAALPIDTWASDITHTIDIFQHIASHEDEWFYYMKLLRNSET